jgi:uncharacterized membrane protein YphA (DoxX/SURF4 family)
VRPKQHEVLGHWLRVYVRYVLAAAMLGYGMAKVFKSQFPAISDMRLMQPYGDSSPMALLWNFMGFSTAYTIFVGAAEVLGGLLLLFRRTATLGALVVIAVMSNIVMLNFCYDVPVKLYSVHLWLMAASSCCPMFQDSSTSSFGTVQPPPRSCRPIGRDGDRGCDSPAKLSSSAISSSRRRREPTSPGGSTAMGTPGIHSTVHTTWWI